MLGIVLPATRFENQAALSDPLKRLSPLKWDFMFFSNKFEFVNPMCCENDINSNA